MEPMVNGDVPLNSIMPVADAQMRIGWDPSESGNKTSPQHWHERGGDGGGGKCQMGWWEAANAVVGSCKWGGGKCRWGGVGVGWCGWCGVCVGGGWEGWGVWVWVCGCVGVCGPQCGPHHHHHHHHQNSGLIDCELATRENNQEQHSCPSCKGLVHTLVCWAGLGGGSRIELVIGVTQALLNRFHGGLPMRHTHIDIPPPRHGPPSVNLGGR